MKKKITPLSSVGRLNQLITLIAFNLTAIFRFVRWSSLRLSVIRRLPQRTGGGKKNSETVFLWKKMFPDQATNNGNGYDEVRVDRSTYDSPEKSGRKS